MATDKQIAFIQNLLSTVNEGSPNLPAEAEQPLVESIATVQEDLVKILGGDSDAVSPRDTSKVIDVLIAAKTVIETQTPAKEFRWRKIGGEFFVVGPVGHDHTEVIVVSNKGERSVALTVGTPDGANARYGTVPPWELNAWRNDRVRAEVRERAAKLLARVDGEVLSVALPGLSASNDLTFLTFSTDSKGGSDVAEIIGGHAPLTLDVTRALDVILPAVEALSDAELAEAARTFGRELGLCALCGRDLTDEASRAEGIGPVCAKKL